MKRTLHHAMQRLLALRAAWPLLIGVGGWVVLIEVMRLHATLDHYLGFGVQLGAALVLLQLARGQRELFGEAWPMAALPIAPRERAAGELLAAVVGLTKIAACVAVLLALVLGLEALPEATTALARWGFGALPLLVIGALTHQRSGAREALGWMTLLAKGQAVAVAVDPAPGLATFAAVSGLAVGASLLLAWTGLLSMRLPRLAAPGMPVWKAPRDPRAQLQRQLWEGLGRDSLRGAVCGLGVVVVAAVLGFLVRADGLEGDLASRLADAGILLLTTMGLVTPWIRRGLPLRSTASTGAGGFLLAYRVLPLPAWMILRRLVLRCALVFGLYTGLALALAAGAWALLDTPPELAFLPLGGIAASPLVWAALIAEGQGRRGQLVAVVGLGLLSLWLGVGSIGDFWLDPAHAVSLPLVLSALCWLAATLLPLRALWPPRQARAQSPDSTLPRALLS